MGWKPIGPALVYVVYMGSTESQDPNEIVLHNHRILSSEPMGVILVFLTGQDDIHTVVQLITEEAQNNGKSSLVLIVLPLYSGLTRADQRETKGGDLNQYCRDIPDVRGYRLCC
ncbi:putative RNA helicase [Helianthus anomalus]